ncbi:hypothetical protein B9Y66_18185 [Stenotrophomonas maltophilia]|nr:hypothetical protein B9Y66_18185 [Stenotrophomonas maltophilia]
MGRVGFAGVSAAWMPRPSLQGRIHGVPRESNPPRQTLSAAVAVALASKAGAGPQALQCRKPHFPRRRLCLNP